MIKINKLIFIFFLANTLLYAGCALGYYYEIIHTNPKISSDMVLLSCIISLLLMFIQSQRWKVIVYHIWMFGMISFFYWSQYPIDHIVFTVEFFVSIWIYQKMKDEL